MTGKRNDIRDQSQGNRLMVAAGTVRRRSGRSWFVSWISTWVAGLMFLAAGTFPAAGDTYQDAITRASQFTTLPWDANLLTASDAIKITTNSTTCFSVVSLMSDYVWTSFYQPHLGGLMTNTVGHESWVTFQPELKEYLNDRTSEFSSGLTGATMRGEMALGMTNSGSHIWAVELWVPEDALFRPAINWTLTDTWTDTSWAGHDTNGPSWFLTNYGESYFQWFTNRQATIYAGNNAFPWSGLGYSYDWYYPTNSSSIVGLSEFVVSAGQGFYVAGATQVDQYLLPEPGTAWLVLAGSGAIFFIRRRNRVAHPTG
ncbi:MAG: PEP-CTERM sorting domain-containing protein [Verrucomicrobiia bacterium]